MSKLLSLGANLAVVLALFLAPGCSVGSVAGCANPETFSELDQASRVECLATGLQGELSGHAAFGLAQIYLLEHVGSHPSDAARESFEKYSRLAKEGGFVSEGVKTEVLTILGYFDALVDMRTDPLAVGRGNSWFDSVCPSADQSERFDCHASRLQYWFQQAEAGSKSENEALYLAYHALYERYQEPIYKGVELSARGFFDLPGAKADFEQLKATGRLDQSVVFGYCDMLSRLRSDGVVASVAVEEASCR